MTNLMPLANAEHSSCRYARGVSLARLRDTRTRQDDELSRHASAAPAGQRGHYYYHTAVDESCPGSVRETYGGSVVAVTESEGTVRTLVEVRVRFMFEDSSEDFRAMTQSQFAQRLEVIHESASQEERKTYATSIGSITH